VPTVTNMQEAAELYRKVEARLAEKKEAYDLACEKDKHALEQLQVFMLQQLNAAGVHSMNIPGVAEVKIVNKRVFGCTDWDMFYTWIVMQNKPELLVKRIHEGNMQALADTSGGFLPPGVDAHTEANIKILKGK